MTIAHRFVLFALGGVLVLLPWSHVKISLIGAPLYLMEIAVLLAAIGALSGFGAGSLSFRSLGLPSSFLLGAALLLLGALVSLWSNPITMTGMGMVKTWLLFPLLTVFLLGLVRPSQREIEALLGIWLSVLGSIALVSLGYFVSGNMTYDGRLSAWYGSPNYLAMLLLPAPFLASYFLTHEDSRAKGMALGFLLPSLAVIFLTRSYAAWLCLALSFVLLAWLNGNLSWKLPKRLMPMAAIFLVLGTLFIVMEAGTDKWRASVNFEERSSLASRLMIWTAAIEMLDRSPVVGIGLGRFQEEYLGLQPLYEPYLEWAVPQPHNLFLALWLQTGLLGLSGFALLSFVWIRNLWKEAKVENKKRASAMLLSIFAAWMLYGLVDTPVFKTDLAFSFWMLVAFGFALKNESMRNPCQ